MATAVLKLGEKAPEESAYIIHVAFYDESGAAMTPNGAIWSMYTEAGTAVNGRASVALTVSNSGAIVLNGSDTAVISGSTNKRIVKLEASYNSAAYGNNLVINREIEFDIAPLRNVT